MKYYFLLIFINLFWANFYATDDVEHLYVDAKILDIGIENIYADAMINNFLDNDIDFDKEIISEEQDDDVLEVQVGKLSRYGPDCYGCSGYLAYGDYVGDGTIYYTDLEYGQVRILAADRRYLFGTIIRVTTSNERFLAIVLDRGSAIGFGKIALFDLLYTSEQLANIDGVSYNTYFEVLRYGF